MKILFIFLGHLYAGIACSHTLDRQGRRFSLPRVLRPCRFFMTTDSGVTVKEKPPEGLFLVQASDALK